MPLFKLFNLIITMILMVILIMNFSIVAVLWFGGWDINRGNMEVGQIIAFVNYITQILFCS